MLLDGALEVVAQLGGEALLELQAAVVAEQSVTRCEGQVDGGQQRRGGAGMREVGRRTRGGETSVSFSGI